MTDFSRQLDFLNKEQYEAATTTEGSLLVLSGAGTGKTRVLTTRLGYILDKGLALPWQCLAVTFTNKAANEMRGRLGEIIGIENASNVWLGTFHSIGAKILRRYGENLGYASNFTILNEDDCVRLIKQIMLENDIDIKATPPSLISDIISRFKDKGLNPEEVSNNYSSENHILARRIYFTYQDRLKIINSMDFGDLLLQMLNLFVKFPEIGGKYQNQFKYILVDEYQDTNVIQYLWLRFLAKGHGNLCCVGDDDQSIYSWRGAEVANILRFSQDYSDANVIRLESNYRSTENILGAASELITNNKDRLGKGLRVAPNRDGSGEKLQLKRVYSGRDEAIWCANEIESLMLKGEKLENIAILVRSNAQTIEFEDEFIKSGIGYKILGGTKFYERSEIRDAIAYLRLVAGPRDDLALLRIINKPRRGMGKVAVDKLQAEALKEGSSIYHVIENWLANGKFKGSQAKAMGEFIENFNNWRSLDIGLDELLSQILNDSGYMQMLREDKSIEAKGRIDNLKELVSVIAGSYETLEEFLEHIALVMDSDDIAENNYVSIMTMHASKGLEFDIVFIPSLEEGIFPSERTVNEGGDKALEEERRLAYVAMTRAKKKLYLSYAISRLLYGKWQNNPPSRFIREIPRKYINDLDVSSDFSSNFATKTEKFIYNKKKTILKIIPGQEVFHKTYGTGTVVDVEGDRVDVRFDMHGFKKIKSDFLEVL